MSFDPKPRLIISRDESASMKGLLICLVVLGHNLFLEDVFPLGTQEWLYSFHVSCFFILPFFYPKHGFSWMRVQTNLKRLFWPYTYMFFLLFLLNSFMLKEILVDFGLIETWVTGNPYTLKHYTGFQYLWFLPALFSMLFLRDYCASCNSYVKWILLLFGFVAFIVFWVFFYKAPCDYSINRLLARVSVFSFFIGLAMLFMGWCVRRIMGWFKIPTILCFIVLLVLLFLILYTRGGVAYNYSRWMARFFGPLFGFALLFNTKAVYNCKFLQRIGSCSLPVYLFHQPLNYVICSLFKRISMPRVIILFISYMIVLSLACFLAKGVMSSQRIKRVLFPR